MVSQYRRTTFPGGFGKGMICGVRRKYQAALGAMAPGRCGRSRHYGAAACSRGSALSSPPKHGPGETGFAQVRRRRRGIDGRMCVDYAACGIGGAMPNPGLCRIDNVAAPPVRVGHCAMRHSLDLARPAIREVGPDATGPRLSKHDRAPMVKTPVGSPL